MLRKFYNNNDNFTIITDVADTLSISMEDINDVADNIGTGRMCRKFNLCQKRRQRRESVAWDLAQPLQVSHILTFD